MNIEKMKIAVDQAKKAIEFDEIPVGCAMFRGDEPKCIIKESPLKEIIWKRVQNKCTEEEYILKVKEQLFNVNHVEYAPFMLSMYSMYKDSFPKM